MSKKAIMTIEDAAPDREVLTVFGKDYELLDYEDMGIIKYSKFVKRYQAIGEQATKAAEMSDAEIEAFEAELNAMVETVVVGITPEAVQKIQLEKKQRVLACFFTVATKKLQGINALAMEKKPD